MPPTLHLFQSASGVFHAVADDKTGANFPKLSRDDAWLLPAEIDPKDLPTDVVVTVYTAGYCMANVHAQGVCVNTHTTDNQFPQFPAR